MEKFLNLRKFVPEISDNIIESCYKASVRTRMEIIQNHRASILILQFKKKVSPSDFVPLGNDTMTGIAPQQIQFVSVLIDFIHQNPQILSECLFHNFQLSDKSRFDFMCSSVIPAFYGFFSTAEHLQLAFPFYTLLLTQAPEEIYYDALVPFYCNGCTFKFIELFYQNFALKLCNDIRMTSKSILPKVFQEYFPIMIKAIVDAYPLLPHMHQFLLKYMKTKGFTMEKILHFFIHSFALPQLLRYLNSTPFKSQYSLLLLFARAFNVKSEYCKPLHDVFDDYSIVEIPPAYTVFDTPYIQLLLSRADVDCLMTTLNEMNKLPQSLNSFFEHSYFKTFDNRPFWIKVYSKKPRPVDASYNWRRVVFEEVLKNKKYPKSLSISNFEAQNLNDFSESGTVTSRESDFLRIWNQVEIQSDSFGQNPILFLTTEKKTPLECERINTINKLLGSEKEQFLEFAVEQSMKDLESKASSFEDYLVHRLALDSLRKWQNIVNDFLKMMIIPSADELITEKLKHIFPKQLIGNPKLIDEVLESVAGKVDMPITRQLQCVLLIQNMLPLMIGPRTTSHMKAIEVKWQHHIEQIRTQIVLPSVFSNKNKNKNQALLLNQKLWQIISLFGSIRHLQFSSTYFVFSHVLRQIEELKDACNIDSFETGKEVDEDSLFQFTIAFSDCPLIITRYILINALVIKQDRFKFMSSNDSDFVLWSKLETAFLKLLSSDSELMSEILDFQEMLIDAKLV